MKVRKESTSREVKGIYRRVRTPWTNWWHIKWPSISVYLVRIEDQISSNMNDILVITVRWSEIILRNTKFIQDPSKLYNLYCGCSHSMILSSSWKARDNIFTFWFVENKTITQENAITSRKNYFTFYMYFNFILDANLMEFYLKYYSI